MSSDCHINLIESLRHAWESLDADLIEPLLAENFHYYSWWVLVEINSKHDYLTYIRECFLSYKNNGTKPIVRLGVNKNDGEYAVAIQFSDGVPILIRIIEREGKVKEMWQQPAE